MRPATPIILSNAEPGKQTIGKESTVTNPKTSKKQDTYGIDLEKNWKKGTIYKKKLVWVDKPNLKNVPQDFSRETKNEERMI